MRRPAALPVLALALLGCGRAWYAPSDGPPDASTATDAGADGGPTTCRVRWTQRATGAGDDLFVGPFHSMGRIYAGATAALVGGGVCGQCFLSASPDGVSRRVDVERAPTVAWGVGDGVVTSLVSTPTPAAYGVRRHDPGTHADLGELGPVQVDDAGAYHDLAADRSGVFYAASLRGTSGGALPPSTTEGRGLAAHYFDLDGDLHWDLGIDGPGDQFAFGARVLPDGDVGIYLWNLGTSSVCVEPGQCVPPEAGGALVLGQRDGHVVSLHATEVGLGGIVANDRGSFAGSVNLEVLVRRAADGSVIWSRPFRSASRGIAMHHDEARRRLVVAASVDGSSLYDGMGIAPLTSDLDGVALLELDDATGELLRSLSFGSPGEDGVSGVVVDDAGRIYVAVDAGGDVDLCAGGGGHGGGSDGLLVAID